MNKRWIMTGILAFSVCGFAQTQSGSSGNMQNQNPTSNQNSASTQNSQNSNAMSNSNGNGQQTAMVEGCVTRRGAAYYIADANHPQGVEIIPLPGQDLSQHVGHHVQLEGKTTQSNGNNNSSSTGPDAASNNSQSNNSSAASSSSGQSMSNSSQSSPIEVTKVTTIATTCAPMK